MRWKDSEKTKFSPVAFLLMARACRKYFRRSGEATWRKTAASFTVPSGGFIAACVFAFVASCVSDLLCQRFNAHQIHICTLVMQMAKTWASETLARGTPIGASGKPLSGAQEDGHSASHLPWASCVWRGCWFGGFGNGLRATSWTKFNITMRWWLCWIVRGRRLEGSEH